MELEDLLNEFRNIFSNQRDKGTKFEDIILNYFKLEPLYSSQIENIWKWSDFPYRTNVGDTGIDLVAKTYTDEYWAIQCKFYDRSYTVNKADVDTFLATSSKAFYIGEKKTFFNYRILVSTTDKYGKNAEDVLYNQSPEVIRIGMNDLLESSIDWSQFSVKNKLVLKKKYAPRPHQIEAINDIKKGFELNDRGKLIMACGTGKTFTSLRAAEEVLNGNGNILFLVPSIALINQTMTEWTSQCTYTYNALVVCSDNKASKGDDFIDLKIPSTTNIDRLCDWVKHIKVQKRDLNIIFSTYQSIDVVSKLQAQTGFKFDLVICDEAHRTTGVKLNDEDESYFIKVHDNSFIKADKRLYMTATPRIYGNNVKNKAQEVNAVLCSMDNEEIFGPVFHNLTFSQSVEKGLLTDYKVLVLAIDEEYVKKELQDLLTDENHEMKLDDSVKIMGCWNGLSKKSINNQDNSFDIDPIPMKRAVAFCNRIKDSKAVVELFNSIQNHINEKYYNEDKKLVNIEIDHIDGSYNALQKKEKINWLKEDIEDGTCRILTNARCLSEGVDVPALDAVIFLNPRSSMVDIIQSVGRVMRKSNNKKYGYIMLPIGVSANENPEDALDNNEKYKIIWSVLQALRAHDDRFNNIINKIELNKRKPLQIDIIGIGENQDDNSLDIKDPSNEYKQMMFDLENLQIWKDSIYAKIVKKVGSRMYWETWAKDVAKIAQTHIERINMLLEKDNFEINKIFDDFVNGLKHNLNDSITRDDAIEMLAQHLITKPVFDALFEGYEFVKNNPVSQTMQGMMEILDKQSLDEEREKLQSFYNSVRERAKEINTVDGKQKIIIELYDKFFKVALPKEVEKLGIVYTPTECVDFIINSVEVILNKEFNKSLSDKGIHIMDGFTGTGTFIVRLLQSGIIKKEDLLYKYTNEIHANEIVLLAYYIAAINIEEVFHDLMKTYEYIPFEGIVLTDTFQLYEEWKEEQSNEIQMDILPENSERAKKQKELPITVIIGNPPYSVGQKNQDDDAKNLKYPRLDKQISETYVKYSNTSLRRNLYDSYIRAFRWASDRILDKGIVSFISNASFIDSNTMNGFRKCIIDEFTSIYIFNLRGNARTSGEQRKKEKDNVFGQGTRTPIAITCLVKNPNRKNDGYIHYYDIGDYLSREDKLSIISEKKDISNIDWKKIVPDKNNNWVNKGNKLFKHLYPLAPKQKCDLSTKSVFTNYVIGTVSNRDAWVYNYDLDKLVKNINTMLEYYNSERIKIHSFGGELGINTNKISWSRGLKKKAINNVDIKFNDKFIIKTLYRPFSKQNFYFDTNIIESPGKSKELFLNENKIIIVPGIGSKKEFSCLMIESIPCLDMIEKGQCFPLYWYSEENDNLLNDGKNKIIKHDGISDSFLNKCRNKYNNSICKEDIFFYVYGILHSNQYISTFADDLKKSLPNIPLVETYNDFKLFSDAGRKLSYLHLNYEIIEPYKDLKISDYKKEDYTVKKMKFYKKDKSKIIYNDYITIENIPLKAYEYIVNGKSAIEWIMDRYQVKVDKKSGIINNPNDWCKEVNNPKYIFDLLLSVINVSVKTVDIINSLPSLNFD